MGAMQRRKGANGERELCAILSDAFGQVVTRKLGQARDGGDDIETPPYHWEVKRRDSIAAVRYLEQCIAALEGKSGTPIVAMREDGGEWVAMMRLADLLPLLREELVTTELAYPKREDEL